MKKVTINDVALRAHVSIGTVSAVINNRSTVREKTRYKVQAAIRELGYHPSVSARLLGGKLQESGVFKKAIGIIIKEMDNPFYAEVIVGARNLLSEHGYITFVCTSEGDYEKEGGILNSLQERYVNGAIIAPVLHEKADLSHLFMLNQKHYPFVLFENVAGLQVNVVSVNNVRASQKAVGYLIDIGHEKIVHIAGPPYTQHTRDRVRGVERAFSHSHLIFSKEDNIVSAGALMEDGYAAGLRIFRERPDEKKPTAISCFNDLVAMGVLRALAELGLRVPEDVSVVGFDDIPAAAFLSVPLTTIRVDQREMGRKATELLVNQLESEGDVGKKRVELEATLVVRASA